MTLELRRYNTRHDEVLRTIKKIAKEKLPDDMPVIVDLDDQYQFPPVITPSDLRPDRVAYSDAQRRKVQ